MSAKSEGKRVVATNRRARYEYEIQDELECGVVLRGTEVKSLRAGQCSIAEAYARVKGGELWLIGANIPEYRCGNVFNHPPDRERKLLLHRRELGKWEKRVKERGMTLVPLELYFSGSRVKVRLGLGKGKKLYDKRRAERDRSDRRDMDRATGRRG